MNRLRLAIVLLAAIAASAVVAHEGMTGTVAQRMEGMKSMAADLKAISNTLRNEDGFNIDKVRARVGELHRNCHDALALFASGESDPVSRAMPAVWEKPAEFASAMLAFDVAVKKLEAAAAIGERAAVAESVRLVGRECSACHSVFRQ